jgi:uncharacterized protein YndB with AHSA1/START domain
MNKLAFSTEINAPANKVWQVLWNDSTYRKWTSVFQEGSYAVSDWKQGSRIQFLSSKGDGMFSEIAELKPNEYMAFRHLGIVKDFKEQPPTAETESWKDAIETYSLKGNNGHTSLEVNLNSVGEYEDYFNKTFPGALKIVKELAENPVMLNVETTVAAPVEKVWEYWSKPEHITRWNNASDDWHTPHAENDLRVGGKFVSRMESKDGSMGFDFNGVYDEVKTNELIAYTIEGGRKVNISFSSNDNETKITESFEAETENSLQLQQDGWQSILDNFKKYTESN